MVIPFQIEDFWNKPLTYGTSGTFDTKPKGGLRGLKRGLTPIGWEWCDTKRPLNKVEW